MAANGHASWWAVGEDVLPLLFPDPLEKTCKLEPHLGRLPIFMSTITPVANPEYVRELSL